MIQTLEAPNRDRDPVGAPLDCSATRPNETSNIDPDLNCEPVDEDLATIFAWRDDLTRRLRIAELCFQTIGLSDERRAELEHEANALKRVCAHLEREKKGRDE